MDDLTGFQRDLLYVIAGYDGIHGIGIADELEADFDTTIDCGRLYPGLNAVIAKGLVEKGISEQRTNTYTLTERGQRALVARRQWENQYLDDAPAVSIDG